MDAGQYYITTITNAAQKIGPMILYAVVGYFIFFKLPFLFFYKSIRKPKEGPSDSEFREDPNFQKKMEEERKREFTERMRNLGGTKGHEQDSHKEQTESKSEKRNENSNNKKKEQSGQKESQKTQTIKATPEEILFKLKPGQLFSSQELKKIYHKLLQESHPDKFRTEHQKEFAEVKTKNINEAYQKLKKRVS